jgi:hypothetical protein
MVIASTAVTPVFTLIADMFRSIPSAKVAACTETDPTGIPLPKAKPMAAFKVEMASNGGTEAEAPFADNPVNKRVADSDTPRRLSRARSSSRPRSSRRFSVPRGQFKQRAASSWVRPSK